MLGIRIRYFNFCNFLSTSTAVLMHLNRVFILKDILIYIIFVPAVFIPKCNIHSCMFISYRYFTIPLKMPLTEISFSFVALQ
jgi:hypothetical protein